MSDGLLNAIQTIYECIGDDFDHTRALESYSKNTDDTGLFLAEIRPLLGGFKKYYSHNIPAEAVTAMVTKHDNSETNNLFRSIALIPDRTPVMRRVFVPDDVHHKTEMYKNVSLPWKFHSDGASLFKRGLIMTTVCGFLRHPEQPEVGQDILGVMAILNNHYCRAMSLQSRLDRLEQALIQSSNMLDLIDFGVVLYGKQGNPVFVNAAAQRIIDNNDGVVLEPQGLKFLNPGANQIFQDLVATQYHSKLPMSAKSGGVVKIPRTTRAKPYSAMLVPMQGLKSSELDSASAAIFLFDPNVRKTTAIDLFVSSYELSRSEAELAHCLALGNSLDEAAEQRGVSRNTAKTQLHSIFDKTETNRQSELVSLLLRSVAGINLK